MHSYEKTQIKSNSRFLLERQIDENNQEEGFKIINFREQHIYLENHKVVWEEPLVSSRLNQTVNEQQDHYLSILLCEDPLIALAQMQQEDSTKIVKNQFSKIKDFKLSQPICSQTLLKNTNNTLYNQLSSFSSSLSQLDGPSQKLCSDYSKNLPGYIFKLSIRLLLKRNYRKKLERVCKKWGVNPQYFIQYYSQLRQSITGPQSLITLFQSQSSDKADANMKEIFEYLIGKVLRGWYLLNALREGKMKSLSSYITVKNKYLLYFSKLFDN